MNLYELSQNYIHLLSLLDDSDELNKDAIQETLEALGDSIEVKAENYCKIIRKYEAEREAIKNEVVRLTDRAAHIAKKVDILKESLAQNLQKTGKTKIEGSLFTIGFRKSSSVNVINIDHLPDEYKREVREVVADKALIKERIKFGVEVPGAEIVEKQNLQIK